MIFSQVNFAAALWSNTYGQVNPHLGRFFAVHRPPLVGRRDPCQIIVPDGTVEQRHSGCTDA
jgi:hypothetical protein